MLYLLALNQYKELFVMAIAKLPREAHIAIALLQTKMY